MLELKVGAKELFDEVTETFIRVEPKTLVLEHSLVSLSKWESITEKPFLSNVEKTNAETILYVSCMVLAPEEYTEILKELTEDDLLKINEYIGAKRSATWFSNTTTKGNSGETITSELIYYWIVALNIPFECQYWHLNRLLTLVRVCNQKNEPPKKMSPQEVLKRNKELNAQRKSMNGSRG